jgi:hypothetical protein
MNEVQFAKKHIRNHFSNILLPHIQDGLWSVYDNAQSVCEKNNQLDQVLKTFQNLLTYIPKWDEERLNQEVQRIQTASNCSYIEEMLTGVLITYLRAFASVQYSGSKDSIDIEFERPPLPKFVHDLYKEAARQCWANAFLFKKVHLNSEQQAKNRREIDQMLETCLDTTLDSFLPWKRIIEKYFKDGSNIPIEQTNMADDDDEEMVSASKGVSFETDEMDEETDEEGPPLKVSDETAEITFETFDEDKKDEEQPVLVPTDELVLNL